MASNSTYAASNWRFIFMRIYIAALCLGLLTINLAKADFETIATGSGHSVTPDSTIEKLANSSSEVACIKDGGSFKKANPAYKAKFGKNKKFCSESPAAKYMAKTLAGVDTVNVIKCNTLSKASYDKYCR